VRLALLPDLSVFLVVVLLLREPRDAVCNGFQPTTDGSTVVLRSASELATAAEITAAAAPAAAAVTFAVAVAVAGADGETNARRPPLLVLLGFWSFSACAAMRSLLMTSVQGERVDEVKGRKTRCGEEWSS